MRASAEPRRITSSGRQYAFVEDNRSVVRISSDLRIAQLTRMSEQLPSILGWDVLQHFTFTTDWRPRIVRLES